MLSLLEIEAERAALAVRRSCELSIRWKEDDAGMHAQTQGPVTGDQGEEQKRMMRRGVWELWGLHACRLVGWVDVRNQRCACQIRERQSESGCGKPWEDMQQEQVTQMALRIDRDEIGCEGWGTSLASLRIRC